MNQELCTFPIGDPTTLPQYHISFKDFGLFLLSGAVLFREIQVLSTTILNGFLYDFLLQEFKRSVGVRSNEIIFQKDAELCSSIFSFVVGVLQFRNCLFLAFNHLFLSFFRQCTNKYSTINGLSYKRLDLIIQSFAKIHYSHMTLTNLGHFGGGFSLDYSFRRLLTIIVTM